MITGAETKTRRPVNQRKDKTTAKPAADPRRRSPWRQSWVSAAPSPREGDNRLTTVDAEGQTETWEADEAHRKHWLHAVWMRITLMWEKKNYLASIEYKEFEEEKIIQDNFRMLCNSMQCLRICTCWKSVSLEKNLTLKLARQFS